MRYTLLSSLMLTIISAVPCSAQKLYQPPTITLEQLRQATVIGSIGQPLGKIVEIEVTIIDGDELRSKEYQGLYLLRVDRVAGEKLAKPPIMGFNLEFGSKVRIPQDGFELYELKRGRKVQGWLSGEERQELQKGFVNTTRRLLAYESGGYRGGPANLPKDYPIWADVGFGFYSHLVLVQEVTLRK